MPTDLQRQQKEKKPFQSLIEAQTFLKKNHERFLHRVHWRAEKPASLPDTRPSGGCTRPSTASGGERMSQLDVWERRKAEARGGSRRGG